MSFAPLFLKALARCGCLLIVSAEAIGLAGSLVAADFQPTLQTPDGFSVPQPGRRFEFPRDHGAHPDFKIEWWYVTGHLFGEQNRRFGFQATFFRRAGPRLTNDTAIAASSTFGNSEVHLAHMALLDVHGRRFLHEERLNRQGWDAGSATNTLAVRNGNWRLRFDAREDASISLQGSIRGEAALSLNLTAAKPLVGFGENGVSRKGASPTASSHYLTFSRLTAAGRVTLDGKEQAVSGQAWMDHEISSSQLDEDQAGWDWAGLQLNDGREIMAYRMRKKDAQTDPYSTLAWVDRQGAVTNFNSTQFTWTCARIWTSPTTGGVYPVHVKLGTTDPANGRPVSFVLEPIAINQELTGVLGGIPYWEGACRVLNEKGEDAGSAYLELTGYVGSLTERFK